MGMLREKMRDDLRLKGYCETTRRRYLGSAQRFAEHYGRSPATMGEQEVRGFLLHLVKESELLLPAGVTLNRPNLLTKICQIRGSEQMQPRHLIRILVKSSSADSLLIPEHRQII